MALIPTLAPDPGADLAAQAQLMRQQKLAQLLATPAPAPEIDMGGDGGGGSKGNSPEGNSILAKMLSEDVGRTAGPSVANFDAPVSTGSGSALSIGNPGSAFPIISHFEGFRSKPYWDVNHFRVGYGSDTITTPDGRVVEVKPGMSVSKDDAARDLSRRIGEFQGGIQNDIGKEAWERLPDSTKAALTSVAYNYGAGWGRKIPSLLTAARAGDVNAISAAIASRSGDNHGVNAKRRQMEAEIAAGRAMPTGPVPAADEAPYKVASLGFQPPPRRQPIAPFPPQPTPPATAPAPAPTPPLPIMATAPAMVPSTPIQPQGGAALTDPPMPPRRPSFDDAPMPPSRSASGVDDMIRRQAASTRPALNAPEEFDLFDEIGRGLEELFGGGGDAGGQSQGVQVAGGGEQYYPMKPGTGSGILGLISDAFREPVPIPAEVQALARSPKQSDRLAYQLMVHGDEYGAHQSAMMTAMFREARDREQAAENRLGAPFRDQYGNLVQIGPNGEYNIRQAAEKPVQPYAAPHLDQFGNYVQEGPDGQTHILHAADKPAAPPARVQEYEYVQQHPEAAGYFTKTRVPDTENTAEIKNFKYAQQNPEFAKSLQRGPSLTPDAITFYGEQVARGDMSPLQNLGRGAQGAENVTAIRNAAVAFAQKNGMDPRAIMEASAGYLGEKAGARTLGTNEANAVNAGVEAMNALKLGRETNAKLPRGQFYPVNKAILAYQFGTSDPNLAAYGQAVATIANTYARAVNPKGLPHEAVVSDTLDRLNGAQGPDALNAIFDIMQKEIEMAQRAPAKARDVLKSNRGNEGGNTPAASPAANIPPEAIDHLRKEPGLAPQFDEQFGPGSAAKVLGR